MKVVYSAAHAVADSEVVSIGGGGAIARQLIAEWTRTRPFDLEVLGPSILGPAAPSGRDLVGYGETRYARFCFEFSEAATRRILAVDPRTTVVLVNDVSEAPDFAQIARAGFPIATIYHVDVVAYIAAIYLRGLVKPETTVRWFERLARLPHPRVLDLVWQRQRDSVRFSKALILPSAGMRPVLERCYPESREKAHVIPWGASPVPTPSDPTAAQALRREFQIPQDAKVLLTLSRISPEKGQDTLLEALLEWESQPSFPAQPPVLFICGNAAFMRGEQHLARLKSLAARLRRIRTFFPGHVSGARKQAFFDLADLYVFPSRHESYGLTLMEALAAGLPAVCLDHHGAREIMRPEFGELASNSTSLWQSIARLLARPDLATLGENGRLYAASRAFPHAAASLATILRGLALS